MIMNRIKNYTAIYLTKRLLLLLIISLIHLNIYAQYKSSTEIGFLAGASYYLGDLNTVHFNQSSPALGLAIRQNIDRRFSYKAQALYLMLRSDERESKDSIANNRGLHFRSPIYEISGQIEFNFLPYETGNPLYSWTPFVYTGISFFRYNPQAENIDGQWVNLQELGTEGQSTTIHPDRKKYSLTQMAIPIGGGLKIAVNENFNVIMEYGIRKTFTDYIDDVSTTYVDAKPSEWNVNSDNFWFSDPNERDYPYMKERGDSEEKDWYSYMAVTLSFKLNTNSTKCNY